MPCQNSFFTWKHLAHKFPRRKSFQQTYRYYSIFLFYLKKIRTSVPEERVSSRHTDNVPEFLFYLKHWNHKFSRVKSFQQTYRYCTRIPFYLKTLGPQVSQRKEFPADMRILCQNSTRSRPDFLAEVNV